jgi:hypothetical protein
MAAAAHNPAFAKKVGIPTSVAKEFNAADKGKKFGTGGGVGITRGGQQQINKQQTRFGSVLGNQKNVPNINLNKYIGKKEGGMAKSDSKEDTKMDKKQDKAMIKKAFAMHDKQEHKGEHTNLSKLRKGGMTMKKMAKGGMAQGGMGPKTMSQDVEKGSNKLIAHGESAVQKRGHTKGKNLGDSGPTKGIMGGAKKMARGGGVESKGKTKGKMVTMCGGGMKKSGRGR